MSRVLLGRALAAGLSLALAAPGAASAPAPRDGGAAGSAASARPRRILSIHAYEPGVPAEALFTGGLRAVLPLGTELELYTEHLDRVRFPGPGYVEGFRTWLRAKYAAAPPDAIVAVGPDALAFLTDPGTTPFPGVPIVFGMVPEGSLPRQPLGPNVTGLTEHVAVAETLALARALFPGTRRVALVGGASGSDRFLNDLLRREVAAAAGGALEVEELIGRPMSELQERLRALPPGSVVLVASLFQDGAGRRWIGPQSIPALAGASAAPVFTFWAHLVGLGSVGGMASDFRASGEAAARVVQRVLAGEAPASIPVARAGTARAILDARQLERFHVPDRLVPAGAEVRFREPSAWARHRVAILLTAGALLLEAALIAALLLEHRRRARAEAKTRETLLQMARVNRVSALGELVVSLAHEINSPLGAVLNNAEAAQRYLAHDGRDEAEVRACLEDIARDATRAAEVLRRIRGVLRRDAREPERVELEKVLRDSVDLVRPDARERDIELELAVAPGLPPVSGDPVQLAQVFLNLLVNALDAVAASHGAARRIQVVAEARGAHVAARVLDSGPGVAEADAAAIFEPFFTTKKNGLGMGLAITRSIVEAHQGSLTVERSPLGGASFEVQLPAARESAPAGRAKALG